MHTNSISKCGGKRLSAPRGPHRPLISVITVVLNGGKTLERSILSVLRINSENFEYIIVDGGSTDGTLNVLRKYEGSIDYWVSNPDRGIYDAMNKAIRLAHGRWIYFLGADDTLRDAMESFANYLQDERTIYYGNVCMTGSQKIYDGPFGPWKLSRRNICHQAIFYPRSVFDSRQYNLKYPVLADYEFNLWCYSNPRFKFQYVPITIANYNNIKGRSSVIGDKQFQRDRGNIIREYMPTWCYIWYRMKWFAIAVVDRLEVRR